MPYDTISIFSWFSSFPRSKNDFVFMSLLALISFNRAKDAGILNLKSYVEWGTKEHVAKFLLWILSSQMLKKYYKSFTIPVSRHKRNFQRIISGFASCWHSFNLKRCFDMSGKPLKQKNEYWTLDVKRPGEENQFNSQHWFKIIEMVFSTIEQ